MKLTLSNIKAIKRDTESQLTKRVCNYVISRWGDYDDKKHIFTDVLHYGCQSGVVGELNVACAWLRRPSAKREGLWCGDSRTTMPKSRTCL